MGPERDDADATESWTRQYRRPYAVTKGRTQPATAELAIEALVSTTELGMATPPTNRLQRSITTLCREVRSVVEIAVHVELPLGATRVLVSDLAGSGLVTIHHPPASLTRRPDSALLERVLDTLRAI